MKEVIPNGALMGLQENRQQMQVFIWPTWEKPLT
jgi:hypothetical protein